jgi:Peptidase family M28
VVAEAARGDANHMVLLGAHLDSVPAGPGVNDDGSGTAFQLELAEQLGKAGTPPRNKIRFLWFDGRSDYVGFINRGIPAGGVFAGAEAPKTAAQVAKYGGVEGEQLDPCYHEDCDTYSTVTGQPPAETMNVYENDPTPANLAIAQQQADSLNGNALRSLEQFKGTLVHAVWYFARVKGALPPKAAAKANKAKSSHRFEYQGHNVARTR